MPGVRLSTLVRRLRRDTTPTGPGCADAELLARFARHRDEAAFELLVWRHGAMVLSACRRVLRHAEDAEDAFQAAFLVLARKAGGVSRGTALPAWLHRVAVRIALRLARSRRLTAPLEAEPAARSADDRAEELGILDEEINRLPERLRLAVVLYYLEGLTAAEAGARLGCPTGTIESRLAAARKKLRDRLAARGVTLPAGVLALLAGHATLAPEAVARITRAAAALVRDGTKAAGEIAGESPVRLAQGAMAMWHTKTWAALAVVTVAVAASAGIGWANRTPPADPVAVTEPDPPKEPARAGLDEPADPRVKKEYWGEPVAFGRLGKEWSYFLAISPDGKRMLVHHHQEMFCVDLASASLMWRVSVGSLHNAAFTPDGKQIATAEWQDGANLYDAATGRLLESFVVGGPNGERPGQVAFLPDGKLVVHTSSWSYTEDKNRLRADGLPTVTQTLNYSLIVWDPVTKKEVRRTGERLKYEGSHIWQLLMGRGQMMQLQQFSENGVSVKQTISFTDPATGKATPTLTIHKDDDLRFDLGPDGKRLLLRSAGQTPRVLEVSTGEVRVSLVGHKRLVTGGAISPDGKLIATVSGTDIDGYERAKLLPGGPPEGPAELIIWDAHTGQQLVRYDYPVGRYDFTKVGFSPDGKYLWAMTTEKRIVVWGQLPFRRPARDGAVGLPALPDPAPKQPAPKPAPPPLGGQPPAPPVVPAGLVADALDKLIESLPKSGRSTTQQIDALFLATLGRPPTATELKRIGDKYGASLKVENLRAIVVELTASPEFEAHVKTLQKRLPNKADPFGGGLDPSLPRFGPPKIDPEPDKKR